MKKLLVSLVILPLFLVSPALANTTVFFDDFTDTDGTALDVHNSTWSILYGTLNIQNNSLFINGRAYVNLSQTVDQCASTDALYPIPGVFYLAVRSSLDSPFGTGPFYYMYNNPEDNGVVLGFQPFSGGPMNLASTYLPSPITGWHNWKLCAVGDNITVYFDDNVLLNAQDSQYTGPGTPFIQDTTPGNTLDNFLYETVLSAPENKDQCKNEGWKNFTNPAFKNQGECNKFVKG